LKNDEKVRHEFNTDQLPKFKFSEAKAWNKGLDTANWKVHSASFWFH